MVSKPGFRIGIYVCRDLEITDFAIPYSVFSVAQRLDPGLEAFIVAETLQPVQTAAGFTVMPNYCFDDLPDMNAVLIPAGFGTRQAINSGRLHAFIRSLPEKTLLVSVSAGSRFYRHMGAFDGGMAAGLPETPGMRKLPGGTVAARRPPQTRAATRAGIVTGGGIESGVEAGFHLLRRAGYSEDFIREVARLMEYSSVCETDPGDFAYDEGVREPKRHGKGLLRWPA
jgi:transcriptional regulator GlxA family with amidase domain